MDKMTKKRRADRAKAEDTALTRILYWVAGGSVLEFLLLLLNKYWASFIVTEFNYRPALDLGIRIMAFAGLICAAFAFYWWRCAVKVGKGRDLPGILCVFMLGVSVSCFATWAGALLGLGEGPGDAGLKLMYVSVPVSIVLALVYYLYQREFFLITCQSALALVGIWLSSQASGNLSRAMCYGYAGVSAVLLVLGALLCRKAQADQGKVEWKDKKLRVFSKNANYTLLYVGAIISLVLLVVAAIGLATVVLYSVGVAWLLVMAVYYTVKLM